MNVLSPINITYISPPEMKSRKLRKIYQKAIYSTRLFHDKVDPFFTVSLVLVAIALWPVAHAWDKI
jgi:hypothetical protein